MLDYYSQVKYIYGVCPCLVLAIALFVFAALVLVIVLWVISFIAVIFVEWFQDELSYILHFLGHEDLEFIVPRKLTDVLYIELLIIIFFADVSLYFVEM